MPEATACPPSVVADTIMRTIELGVTISDAAVDEKVTTIFCAPVTRDPRCPDCGRDGRYRDTITRPLTDLPVAGYPLVLRVAVPRYRCLTPECGRVVFNPDLGKLASPRSATTRRCTRYVLRRLMIDRTTISAIAAELGVSWHTVNTIAMQATAALVTAAGPDRLAGVRVIGVDEHRWAPRRVGPEGFVTLIIDLTPVHDQSGPARLLDLVPGRSAAALADWLAAQPTDFAAGVQVVAMDGFARLQDRRRSRGPRRGNRHGPVLCRRADYADVGWVAAGQGANDAGEVGIIRVRSRWFLHYQRGTRACTYIAFTIPMGFGLPARWRRCPAS